MSESYGSGLRNGGCVGGNCKNIRDVVARPSLYSGQQPGSGNAMKGPSQYYSHTGMSPSASFTTPQPPPVNAATAAYGYPQSSPARPQQQQQQPQPTVVVNANCSCCGGAPHQMQGQMPGQMPMAMQGQMPMAMQGQMPMPGQMQGQMPIPGQMQGQGQMPMPGQMQGQMPMPGQMQGQMAMQKQMTTMPPSQPQQQQPRPSPTTTAKVSPQSTTDFLAIGRLVCLKCYAENHRIDQGDVIDANGRLLDEGCAKTCVARGSPVGVVDASTGNASVLLTQSPNLVPLILNNATVRVAGRTAGADIAQNGAVLVDSIDVALPERNKDGSYNWTTVLVRPSPTTSTTQ